LSAVPGWTKEELERVGEADELELTADGRAVTIWVVRVGDDLYVRAYRGRDASWFRRVQQTHHGHISAGGVEADVELLESAEADDAIDAAYRAKYQRYGGRYVDPMVAPDARETTLKLVPRR
jgi:hypothetical protein